MDDMLVYSKHGRAWAKLHNSWLGSDGDHLAYGETCEIYTHYKILKHILQKKGLDF